MEAVASGEGPKGGLGVWIAASLLPVLPLFFTRLPEAACYSYEVPGPEVRWRMAILVAGTALSSFAALGLGFDRLRSLRFTSLSRTAAWSLGLIAAVAMVQLALSIPSDSALGTLAFSLFYFGIPLSGLAFLAVVIAWVSRWSAAEVNRLLPAYLLIVGAFGYPGLLAIIVGARGGAFC